MHLLTIKVFIVSSLLLLFSSSPLAAQVKIYEAEWKKVEGFIEQGLPKSALQEVRKIYTMAKRDKQQAQVVKSVIHLVRLQSENIDQ
jgi:hypothetical protein